MLGSKKRLWAAVAFLALLIGAVWYSQSRSVQQPADETDAATLYLEVRLAFLKEMKLESIGQSTIDKIDRALAATKEAGDLPSSELTTEAIQRVEEFFVEAVILWSVDTLNNNDQSPLVSAFAKGEARDVLEAQLTGLDACKKLLGDVAELQMVIDLHKIALRDLEEGELGLKSFIECCSLAGTASGRIIIILLDEHLERL